MTIRHAAYVTATSIAPIVLTIVVISLIGAEFRNNITFYRIAFYAMVLAVLLMEFRVRLGYRTIRGKLFYLHLMVAIPFLISLGFLAFYTRPLWLILVSDILFGVLAVAGLTLFYRSIRAASKKHATAI